MNATPQHYTVEQIARALGRKRQAVARLLRDVAADGGLTVRGIEARTWSVCALPVQVQHALNVAADARGFRNAEHLLAQPKAAGAGAPSPTAAAQTPRRAQLLSLADESDFQALADYIALFKNPAAPAAAEKSVLWLRVFELYEEKLTAGRAPKKLKRALLNFLCRRAGFLVSAAAQDRAHALRINFDRKRSAWLKSERAPAALADRRAESSGNFRAPQLSADDRDKLIHHAVFNCGGRYTQAWRELLESCELGEEIRSYYLSNPARKSHVPIGIAESIKYEVGMMDDIHHGPRQDKLNGAHLVRDWSTVFAGDWYQADDATLPIYYYVPDGQGWYSLMRGQTLFMIDLRSTRILGFVLLSERNYTAASIRSLTTRVCNQYGLPRKGFYYENGIWRARLIKGVESGPMSFAETEMGLRDFGLRFVHARLPRAKPVEGVIGAAQDLMEGILGYVGRNEQIEKFERVQKAKREVESGKVRPQGLFLSADEWTDTLETLCARYNAAPQNGKMTGGLSPDEAYREYRKPGDPLVKFSPECRFLLSNHRRPVKVTANGITLRFGSLAHNYRNVETGRLRGQVVLAWFDPENPEILTVTDMNRKNAFCVSRTQEVPAMDAPPEIMAQEQSRIAEHQSHAKARYRILKAKHATAYRPMVADRDTLELGALIGEQRAALETVNREQAARETKGRKLSAGLKLTMPQGRLLRPETVPALERLNALLAEDDPATAEKESNR